MPPKGWKKPRRDIEPDPLPPEPPPQREYAATWAEDFAMLMSRVPDEAFVGMLSKTGFPREQQRDLLESFRRLKKS